jgi:pyruvate,water dikinase
MLGVLDPDDPVRLAETARACSALVSSVQLPAEIRAAVAEAYADLDPAFGVVVRSSAGDDLDRVSFAGMNATFTDVRGVDAVLACVRSCWASLYAQRVIAYRAAGRIETDPRLAVVVQPMLPADVSGVVVTADPSFGGTERLVIEASRGTTESILSGRGEPDTVVVARHGPAVLGSRSAQPTGTGRVLDDAAALDIARLALQIEKHLGCPQDIAWARAGGRIWILRVRPITTLPHPDEATSGRLLLRGLAASKGVRSGPVRVLASPVDALRLRPGEVLVAPLTSADWVPALRRAAALVTDAGCMTCHAAVVSRELGVPAVVATHTATSTLRDGDVVTVDGSHGEVRAGAYVPDRTDASG